ncbi:MAG: ABC transporter ATP-binding protein [Lautropia sp.]|nr:ABC transporter ATP-binding protein [Lautropia sp.]
MSSPLFSTPGGHAGTLESVRPALLSLAGVQTLIGPYHILHGVDLEVPERGLTMLLGRNGAGKTTTLRTIMGLWRASQGRIVYEGKDITRRDTPDIAMAGVGYVPESMGIFAGLTVRENLVLAARRGDIDDTRLQWVFGLFPALRRFWTLPAGLLSGGQKQMLATARAIIEPKKLLLIDEPTKGLAPSIINNMIDAFKELKASTTLLVVEQNFRFAQALGDTVAVMDSGRIVHQGSMAALAEDARLQQSLLGLDLGAHQ